MSSHPERLTQVQVERVVALHRQGLPNKVIAERLGLRADETGITRIRRAVKRAQKEGTDGRVA